jgi:CDP-diacylglycerol--serine O-phosphatidyltransferase
MKLNSEAVKGRTPYALPTIFTVGTLFCGYYCLMKTVQALSLPPDQLDEAARLYNHAALAIGLGVFTDGMDGRIARLTNAVSDFGREIDSLADVITFGVAPAMLAVAWGIRPPELAGHPFLANILPAAGYLLTFLYVTCGAARLARFNVQKNPRPKNPGRPGRKYFVGLPIPPAAGMLAAVVHFHGGYPIQNWWPGGALWLLLIGLLGFLMVSTWRYTSLKDISVLQIPSLVMVVFFATLIFLIWNFSEPMLLAIATAFVASGIVTRIGGLLRFRARRSRRDQETPRPSESKSISGEV